jgi:putative transposase
MTDMKKSRFTEGQIIGFLRQAEAGMAVKELCRKGGFSDAMFYKWRARFGGMDASDAKRLHAFKSVRGSPHGGRPQRRERVDNWGLPTRFARIEHVVQVEQTLHG